MESDGDGWYYALPGERVLNSKKEAQSNRMECKTVLQYATVLRYLTPRHVIQRNNMRAMSCSQA